MTLYMMIVLFWSRLINSGFAYIVYRNILLYCYAGGLNKKITKTTKMYTPGFVNTFDRLLLLYQVCFQTVRLHYISSLKYKFTRTLRNFPVCLNGIVIGIRSEKWRLFDFYPGIKLQL